MELRIKRESSLKISQLYKLMKLQITEKEAVLTVIHALLHVNLVL